MKKILISSNDTGSGKTFLSQITNKYLSENGGNVQYIKLVETGVSEPEDAKRATAGTGAEDYTLFTYEAPLAPVCAAREVGEVFNLEMVMDKLKGVREDVDWRIYEGAGGFGCPLDGEGRDGRDLVKLLDIDYLILVVEHRLGAINQARMLECYAEDADCAKGIWLFDTGKVSSLVEQSNLREIRKLETPLWGKNDEFYTEVFG